MSLVEWVKARRQYSRALKEARLLLREARYALRKHGPELSSAQATELEERIGELSQATTERDGAKLTDATQALDRVFDQHLSHVRKSSRRQYVESIAVAVLIALFLRAFVVEAFKIPSGSMIPTLQVGDQIFVNKFIYGVRIPYTNLKFGTAYRPPRRGEVIVFIFPLDQDKDFIKRVVAVEGDTVEIRDNVVYVNGEPVERQHVGDCEYEDYEEQTKQWEERRCDAWTETVHGNTYTTLFNRNGGVQSWRPQKVPPRSVFVMGDNRDNSHDSRYWGFVPFDLIKGKAMFIWWSNGEPEGIRFRRLFQLVR